MPENTLSALVKRIKTKDTLFICLSGSRISGNFNPNSDYDFFILTTNTDKVKIEKKSGKPALECFYYSIKRMKNCIKSGDSIPIDAFASGKLLFTSESAEAKKMLKRITKAHLNFSISPLLLARMRYRADMLKEKIISVDVSDEMLIRLLASYYLEDIIRMLFYINHRVHPSIKEMGQSITSLNNVPPGFAAKLGALLGNAPAQEIKKVMLETVEYIQKRIGNSQEMFELKPSKTEGTKIF